MYASKNLHICYYDCLLELITRKRSSSRVHGVCDMENRYCNLVIIFSDVCFLEDKGVSEDELYRMLKPTLKAADR